MSKVIMQTIALWICCAASFGNSEQYEPVNQYGDLSKMVLRGLNSWAPSAVRLALRRDVEVLLATHPLAPLADLPMVLEERLLAGLWNSGCFEARVSVAINRELSCVEAVAHEGPSYRCGEIEIEGPIDFPEEILIQRLNESYPPSKAVKKKFLLSDSFQDCIWLDIDGEEVELSPAPWKIGDPVHLVKGPKKALCHEVDLALKDLGCQGAQYDVHSEADERTHDVTLVIRFTDPGKLARLGEIEIVGNHTNLREMIEEYLELKIGMQLGRETLMRIEHDLWRSGRFVKHDITSTIREDGTWKLKLTLVESNFTPPLGQPLTKEQVAMLTMRQWLTHPKEWDGDFVLKVGSPTTVIRAILAPDAGVLLSLQYPSQERKLGATLLGNLQEVGYYPGRLPIKLEATTPDVRLFMSLDVGLQEEAKDNVTFTMTMGIGFKSARLYRKRQLLTGTINLSPAAAIAYGMSPQVAPQWNGELVTLNFKNTSLLLNSKTGRLLSFQSNLDEDDWISIQFVEGAYAQQREKVVETTNKYSNAYQSEHPASSLILFFTQEEIVHDLASQFELHLEFQGKYNYSKDFLLVRRLVKLGVLRPIDRWITSYQEPILPTFRIPSTHSSANLWASMALQSVQFADDLFPRESWAWTIWREAGFALGNKRVYTTKQLQTLFESEEVGPLCYLVVARMLEFSKPALAAQFARRGRYRLNKEYFRFDYQPLLDSHSLFGRCLFQSASILGNLEPDELELLTDSFPEPWLKWLESLRLELSYRANEPIEQALPAALEESWEQGLQELLFDSLRRYR